MHAAGITMDLAPVLDLDNGVGPNNRDPDGTRSFSLNPGVAAADGVAFLQGLEAGGVVPVVKHFPGLGQASGEHRRGARDDPTVDRRCSMPASSRSRARSPPGRRR